MFFTMGLKAGHFTHVIVDEAGQATEPEVLVAMALAAGPDGQVGLIEYVKVVWCLECSDFNLISDIFVVHKTPFSDF